MASFSAFAVAISWSQGRVFLIGLHRGLVVFEPRQPAVHGGDVLFELAPLIVIRLDLGFEADDVGRRGGNGGGDRLFGGGKLREPFSRLVGGGVQGLECDEGCE